MIGNCGVGFAPCRRSDHGRLIELMEGVEDIPEMVMTEGLTWEWETFPQYLDLLGRRRFDVDVAAQLPHSALRLYVMGKGAVARMPSTSEDNERMAALASEAMLAGALASARRARFFIEPVQGRRSQPMGRAGLNSSRLPVA